MTIFGAPKYAIYGQIWPNMHFRVGSRKKICEFESVSKRRRKTTDPITIKVEELLTIASIECGISVCQRGDLSDDFTNENYRFILFFCHIGLCWIGLDLLSGTGVATAIYHISKSFKHRMS